MAEPRDPFEPLPPDERVRSPRPAAEGEWRALVPVPEDAPPPPARHAKLGEPVMRWEYRDAEGRVLGYKLRFATDTNGGGEKTYRPLTFCEGPNGRREWRWQDFPTPRPLYGLDRLAARPEAPVLIVEGEKTADAAERLFAEFVSICSPNGADAPQGADWRPLAGRNLFAWPDADPKGCDYVSEAARLALAAGATSICVVSVPEDFPTAWDLADAPPPGWDAPRLRELLEAAGPAKPEPSDAVRFPFQLRADGVYAEEDKDGSHEWVRFCSRLEVVALTRSDASEDWGRLLRVLDSDGVVHEWAMPMSLLAGGGDEYRAELLRLGLRIEPGKKARDRLHQYLTTTEPDARVRCVPRIGWHGRPFVLPNAVFGSTGAERTLLQTSAPLDHAFRIAGTLADWQQQVAAPCAGNSRLVFAVSAAFAAPLLALVPTESGGFHYVGGSTIGKTTTLMVAGSPWGGREGPRGYLEQWRATANGLEAVAAAHCDALLCLDELAQVDPREAGEIAYMLANGSGKRRARRDGSGRPSAEWRVLFLSSGELGLADKVREDRGRRVTAGQTVRVVDVPADAGAGLGLFEALHGFPSANALAQHLRTASSHFYGVPARAFLERVAQEPEAIAEAVRGYRDEFVGEHCPTDADGQVRRVAERFGLVAAGGELASALGVVPWNRGEATGAAAACFRAWLEARGGSGPAELAAALEHVRAFFAAHGSSRFESVYQEFEGKRSQRTPNRAGWWRDAGSGGREYLVTPSVFREELALGLDPKAFARELVQRGWLVPDGAGKSSQSVNIPGHGKVRVYVFAAAVLSGEGSSDA